MKYYLLHILLFLSFQSFSQEKDLAQSILKGNWQFNFVNHRRMDTVDHSIGDTVILYKVPKRLKSKKQRPARFQSDGIVLVPQTAPGSCGNASSFEALWDLKWSEYADWRLEKIEGESFLIFSEFTFKLIGSERKNYTFLISEITSET